GCWLLALGTAGVSHSKSQESQHQHFSALGCRLLGPRRLSHPESQELRAKSLSVQFVPNLLPDFASENVHEVLRARLLHGGQTAEALDEKPTALLADARQVIELAVRHAL